MAQSAPDNYSFIGQTVGNYEVTAKLGEGGMGSVYLAEHPLIGKKVALKVLHPEFVSDTDVVARFFTEAKAVNDIQHPNIVDIIDYGTMKAPTGEDVVFFLMEHLDGLSLADVVLNQSPLPEARALFIASQIADALGASHHHGIVHRDLKPDNVFLISRGRRQDVVKVLDFGIAKLTGDQPGSRRTRTGIVIGTPYYMSPEQCEGRGNVDNRTDVYALGVVLFELMTGRVPFEGEGYGEILVQHITQLPPRLTSLNPNISPYAEAVVLKSLEKHRDLRYASMEEFMAALGDPAGYVESNGGIEGFLTNANVAAPVRPPTEPTQALPSQTPAPHAMHTPAPGYPGTTPAPGQLTPAPYVADGLPMAPATKSRAPLFIGIGVLAAAGIGAAVVFGGGNSSNDTTPSPAVAKTDPGPSESPPVKPPDEPPATPPPAKVPATVQISLTSSPDGATVFVADEPEPRGKTPLKLKFDAGKVPVKIRFERAGYVAEYKDVVPDVNRALDLELKKVRIAKPDRRKPKRPKRDTKRDTKRDQDPPAIKKDRKKKVGDDILAPEL